MKGVICRRFSGKYEEYHVLKSPINKYIRIDHGSYLLWLEMDGRQTVSEICYLDILRTGKLSLNRILSLISLLGNNGFLENWKAQPKKSIHRKIRNDLFSNLSEKFDRVFRKQELIIHNIDKILSISYKAFVKYLFSKISLCLYWAIAVLGILVFLEISSRYNGYGFSISYSTFIDYLAAIITVIILIPLHEGAHAYAVKHFGYDVHNAGVMIYLGSLAFFVDTQDIWLAEKKNRVAVSWAGPFANIILGGLLAIWISFFPAFKYNYLIYRAALINLVVAMINLNPLLELDGYYILIDLLGIPSLRQRSFDFLQSHKP